MQTQYPLDYVVNEYLLTLLTPYRYNAVISIINTVNDFNMLQGNKVINDLSELEASLTDLILTNEDIEKDRLTDLVVNHITLYFVKYLNGYGIYLNKDVSVSYLLTIMTGWYVMSTIDSNLLESVYDVMNDTELEDDETIFATLISTYTEMELYDILDGIEDISSDCSGNLYAYLKDKANIESINEDILLVTTVLSSVDERYLNTKVVSDYVNGIIRDININTAVSDMYSTLETYTDTTMMPYEISATFFIVKDTRDNMLPAVIDMVNYENISILHDKPQDINNVRMLTEKLVSDITLARGKYV